MKRFFSYSPKKRFPMWESDVRYRERKSRQFELLRPIRLDGFDVVGDVEMLADSTVGSQRVRVA
jgi:hypothetical protein